MSVAVTGKEQALLSLATSEEGPAQCAEHCPSGCFTNALQFSHLPKMAAEQKNKTKQMASFPKGYSFLAISLLGQTWLHKQTSYSSIAERHLFTVRGREGRGGEIMSRFNVGSKEMLV